MGSKNTLLAAYNQSDYRAGQRAVDISIRKHLQYKRTNFFPIQGSSKLSSIFIFARSSYLSLRDRTDLPARSLEANERVDMTLQSDSPWNEDIQESSSKQRSDRTNTEAETSGPVRSRRLTLLAHAHSIRRSPGSLAQIWFFSLTAVFG